MRLFNDTGIDDRTRVDFLDLGLHAAGEGGRHEEVAGQEDQKRNEEPFCAYEHYGKYLETTLVAHPLQQLLCLHLSLYIIYLQQKTPQINLIITPFHH